MNIRGQTTFLMLHSIIYRDEASSTKYSVDIQVVNITIPGESSMHGRSGTRVVTEVLGNRSCSDQDTLIEQSITVIKQSQLCSI